MDRAEILVRLRGSLSEVLNREVPELGEDARLFEDLALDSTGVIELLMVLEDSVGLEIDPEELGPEVFKTVGSLASYVAAGLAKTAKV
ncbi:acyl carrier protein [Catenulispora rubra]|uniref:acyl carrier protein n=1 Tax=Catenulispora rubra TaxID=280293 RepID=UPI001891F443|nr:phosphopantetheine-binding protein [Catenulispora rubra]